MKMPIVKKDADGTYSVSIAPDAIISWTFEPHRNGTLAVIKIKAPSLTTWGEVNEAADQLT